MRDDVQNEMVPLADRFSLSPEEASALTGIGTTRIREAAASGDLQARKHGTRTIILPDDLKAWLKSLPKVAKKQPPQQPQVEAETQ
ncbi:excisionase family DNA binding protein [Bradyrhizobium sp. JR7.2]|uniref:helix-turn-helix domain-containing protein n=1 Tax=Bradyrhizobium sp. JR7.2 TaxID=3156375 RepID=UPI00339865E4